MHRHAGLLCGVVATSLGLCYLTLAGAPASYIALNAGAAVIGVVLYALTRSSIKPAGSPLPAFVLSLALLATTISGASSADVNRWIAVGPLTVQPSLILLPFLLISFARTRSRLGAAGVCLAAVALAFQPDRAMAGVTLLAVSTLALIRFERVLWVPLVVAAGAFVVALSRPDTLPAMPYVERIFYTAFETGVSAGAAVVIGAMVLLLPAVIGARTTPAQAHEFIVFGSVWTGIILAAALGNYPTPVVGYGGSAILGYFLSVATLPSE